MLYAGMVEQSLLLKLLKLFRIEAEGVRPKVRPCVDERGAQRFCKRIIGQFIIFRVLVIADPCVIAWHA